MSKSNLVKLSLLKDENTILTNTGALVVQSGTYSGRSPDGKFIVRDKETDKTVDWSANQSMTQEEWASLLSSVTSYVEIHRDYGRDFYKIRAAAGKTTKWESRTKKLFSFICESPKQKLFISNMFEEVDFLNEKSNLDSDVTVFCIPSFSEEPKVVINFSEKKIVITGTDYLGEIKKSVFTYMNYILTDSKILPMHCSINTDIDMKNPAIFFGLSGTGKTTLSAASDRLLLGDDEHGWSDNVLFNIESGCYAKTIDLSLETEPEIFLASQKFGSILENVVVRDGDPDFSDASITKNGRTSYSISALDRHIPSGYVGRNPRHVIMLTCDATGVLPPVSKLSIDQAKKMFLVGYTSKIPGTEVGIQEPISVFSPCFGAPFLPRAPSVYANMLESLLESSKAQCWLVNTGWSGGSPGKGKRISLKTTRSIISDILTDKLNHDDYMYHKYTGLMIPNTLPTDTKFSTKPESAWKALKSYKEEAKTLMSKIEEKINATL